MRARTHARTWPFEEKNREDTTWIWLNCLKNWFKKIVGCSDERTDNRRKWISSFRPLLRLEWANNDIQKYLLWKVTLNKPMFTIWAFKNSNCPYRQLWKSICFLWGHFSAYSTVDSRYLEFQGTLWSTSRYPYLDILDLQNWRKNNSNNHI